MLLIFERPLNPPIPFLCLFFLFFRTDFIIISSARKTPLDIVNYLLNRVLMDLIILTMVMNSKLLRRS